MNTIIVNLCEEDRQRLDRIIAALERPAPKYEHCANDVAESADITPEEKPVEVQEAPKVEPKAEPEQPSVGRADIQKKVVELSAAGKKDSVRDVVLAYGNTKVSDIPEDKLAEVWQKLTSLEG